MQNKKILVVEDSPVDEMLTMRALKQSKVSTEIDVVRDGREALDYLFAEGKYKEHHNVELPALVILDLHLPSIDGLEVLRRIRNNKKTKLLPVVILTSADDEASKITGYELGVNSFVRKPLQFSDFILAVTQLGRYWLATSESPTKNQ